MASFINGVFHQILHNRDLESSESFVIQARLSDFAEGPMWTKENRGRCNPGRQRDPGDSTDEKSAEPLIAAAKRGSNQSAESGHGY